MASSTEPKTVEGRIVAAIFDDLRDRHTLKQLFSAHDAKGRIDPDTQNEIRRVWRKIIREEIKREAPDAE